jgi:hypothetical protein
MSLLSVVALFQVNCEQVVVGGNYSLWGKLTIHLDNSRFTTTNLYPFFLKKIYL